MTLPLQVAPVAVRQFFNADGSVMTGGTLNYFVTGTTTPLEVFSDSDGNVSLGTIVDIGDQGYPITSGSAITAIYPPLGGYKEVLKDANGNTIYTADLIENVAETFLGTQANIQSEGSKSVADGYLVTSSDNLVTINQAAAAVINLPPAAERGRPLVIINLSTTANVTVTPNGSETINLAATCTLGVNGTGSDFPFTVTLLSDGVSNWWIQSDHWGTP